MNDNVGEAASIELSLIDRFTGAVFVVHYLGLASTRLRTFMQTARTLSNGRRMELRVVT